MFRACELKDQTYKKTRTLQFSEMLQKPVFALPGCQRMSVNTLSCDTLGLAGTPRLCRDPVNIVARDPVACRETGFNYMLFSPPSGCQ